jgi:hypothetical protein
LADWPGAGQHASGVARMGPRDASLPLKTRSCIFRDLEFDLFRQSRSSVVEHLLDMEVVGGSIPLATTNSLTDRSARNRDLLRRFLPEIRMLKFLGSTIGIIFLVGLVVVILLLKFIF